MSFAQPRTFERNEFILLADCPAESIYLIRRGEVRCFLLDSDGRETTTAILGRGQIVGLAPFLGRQVHHEFAQALSRVEMWVLPAEQVKRTLSERQALQGLVLGCLVQRFELALGILRAVSLLPVSERLCDIQQLLCASLGANAHSLKRTTLAGLLQIRPETLARVQQTRGIRDPASTTTRDKSHASPGRLAFGVGDLVVDGDPPSGRAGLVVSGQLQLSLVGPGSRAVVVDSLEKGDLFAFGTLLGLPSVDFRLIGLSPGEFEVLDDAGILHWLAQSSTTCVEMLTRFARRLERLEYALTQAAVPDVRDRLIRVLGEVAERDGEVAPNGAHLVPARWSHIELARRIGVCRETVSRAMAALTRAGVIGREGRRIVWIGCRPAEDVRQHPPSLHAIWSSSEPHRQTLDRATPMQRTTIDDKDHRSRGATRRDQPQRTSIVWVPIGSIDEPSPQQNSRRAYPDGSIRELAASLRQDGILQPLCVRPNGARYEVVFGVRRLRAARQAGLNEVPCIIRVADDDRAFLLNALENLHREQLSNMERVRTIERLAATGLGVREISRRTGFNPSTISRWLRINGRPALKHALEAGRIDIARAVILVEAPESCLPSLMEQAARISAAELRRQVGSVKRVDNGRCLNLDDRYYLAEALRYLRAVRTTHQRELVGRIQRELDRLSS